MLLHPAYCAQSIVALFALVAVLPATAERPPGVAPEEIVQRHPHDPAQQRAAFKVVEGFEVELFASEKEGIANPIASRFDRFGRLWVIGSFTYPQIKPGEEPNDYVRVLEDTNGDGKADKSTLFA